MSEPNGPGRIRVAAPCRADFAGGTLDIWPLGLLHPGSLTVNMAIPVEVELAVDLLGEPGSVLHTSNNGEVNRLTRGDAGFDLTAAVVFALVPGGGVRVRVISQAPIQSGIGGSSSYGIALAHGLGEILDRRLPEERLVALIRDLEARVLGVPTGEQDHWAAVRGGILALHLEAGGNRVETLAVAPEWLVERATVFFSGNKHHSGMVNWQVIRRRLDGERRIRESFAEIAAAAVECRNGLVDEDDDRVASAIRCEWKARRRLTPEVSTPELDDLVSVARDNGATAVKACGAGGGGSILVWHPPGIRAGIVLALEEATHGGGVLAAGAAADGCRVLGSPPPIRES